MDNLKLDSYLEIVNQEKLQEGLDKVVKELSKELNFSYQNVSYEKHSYNNFYGVYYSEAEIKRKPETLTFLTNEVINKAKVNYLENSQLQTVYNINKLGGFDPYEVYLDGASAYIEITNDMAQNNRELVVFRDSFASSLTPLLINYYHKITLIDNRYISSNDYKNLINFDNQDVLFIYSTLVINSSYSLKG